MGNFLRGILHASLGGVAAGLALWGSSATPKVIVAGAGASAITSIMSLLARAPKDNRK